jgi:hypothetical protein
MLKNFVGDLSPIEQIDIVRKIKNILEKSRSDFKYIKQKVALSDQMIINILVDQK